MGAFTAPEVILTTRPKPLAAIRSTVALISSIGVIMLASTACIHSSRLQSRKSPGGGPPLLLIRISTCGQAASSASRTSSRPISPATGRTSMAGLRARNASAVLSSTSALRELMARLTPSLASASAQPRPNPLLAAHTTAQRPAIPRSIPCTPVCSIFGLNVTNSHRLAVIVRPL